jgi:hypothetical protein
VWKLFEAGWLLRGFAVRQLKVDAAERVEARAKPFVQILGPRLSGGAKGVF